MALYFENRKLERTLLPNPKKTTLAISSDRIPQKGRAAPDEIFSY